MVCVISWLKFYSQIITILIVEHALPSVDLHLYVMLSFSIPFSTEDLSIAIPAIDYVDIELPESLHHYASVQLLLKHHDPQPV